MPLSASVALSHARAATPNPNDRRHLTVVRSHIAAATSSASRRVGDNAPAALIEGMTSDEPGQSPVPNALDMTTLRAVQRAIRGLMAVQSDDTLDSATLRTVRRMIAASKTGDDARSDVIDDLLDRVVPAPGTGIDTKVDLAMVVTRAGTEHLAQRTTHNRTWQSLSGGEQIADADITDIRPVPWDKAV